MRRREILKLFVVGAGATALSARSWSLPLPVIGYLDASSASGRESVVAAFRDGLKELGFIEGQNVRIEQHWADNDIDRLPHLITDLVRQKIDVIFVAGNIAAQRVHSAVQAIPVVFVVGNDPVNLGLVKSLNQPSGNITGVTPLNADLGAKRLEVVHELLPTARLVGLLINPANPLADTLPQELAEPARGMGLSLRVVKASNDRELDDAFESVKKSEAAALVIGADTFFNGRAEQLATLALRHKLPTVYGTVGFAAAGGLISYGASIPDGFRIAGRYVGRILKGEKPGNLPVQQASRIELVINLKTARALGVAVPTPLLVRADTVIE